MTKHRIIQGDCRKAMKNDPDNFYHSIVTDPPYGLSFMGKEWDHGVPGVPFWQEALRVCRPGAHMLAFGGTRTHHRLMVAIEDAGWEIRDCLMWVYGSGFPKSLDVSKAIDKAAGVEREVVGQRTDGRYAYGFTEQAKRAMGDIAHAEVQGFKGEMGIITAPATDAAKQWNGWGTALKPAWEPIILARKPLEGTVAENVQKWGTGALNIDACRIPTIETWAVTASSDFSGDGGWAGISRASNNNGRFPANLIHDGSDEVLAVFPQSEGQLAAITGNEPTANGFSGAVKYGGMKKRIAFPEPRGDSGSAARFFYCAKASTDERNVGCDAMPKTSAGDCVDRQEGSPGMNSPRAGAGRVSGAKNSHPTVKPLSLIRYLCRLVTPPGGRVLDMFGGSGTTMLAANEELFNCTIIEIDPGYIKIIKNRLQVGSQLDTGVVSYRFEEVTG